MRPTNYLRFIERIPSPSDLPPEPAPIPSSPPPLQHKAPAKKAPAKKSALRPKLDEELPVAPVLPPAPKPPKPLLILQQWWTEGAEDPAEGIGEWRDVELVHEEAS